MMPELKRRRVVGKQPGAALRRPGPQRGHERAPEPSPALHASPEPEPMPSHSDAHSEESEAENEHMALEGLESCFDDWQAMLDLDYLAVPMLPSSLHHMASMWQIGGSSVRGNTFPEGLEMRPITPFTLRLLVFELKSSCFLVQLCHHVFLATCHFTLNQKQKACEDLSGILHQILKDQPRIHPIVAPPEGHVHTVSILLHFPGLEMLQC